MLELWLMSVRFSVGGIRGIQEKERWLQGLGELKVLICKMQSERRE